jgi:alpha-galactosidase
MFIKGSLILLLLVFITCTIPVDAILKAQPIIPIESDNTALVLKVGKQKLLHIIYLGKKLTNKQAYANIPNAYNLDHDYTGVLNSAYTPSGSRNHLDPAITVKHANGSMSLTLRYVSHKTKKINHNVWLYTFKLKDPAYHFYVKLFYKVYKKEDVFEQWNSITNDEKGDVTLYKYASANLYLKANSYWLKEFHGNWAREMQPETSKLTHGIKTIDSKLGTRENLFEQSVFMIGLDDPPNEDEGEVLYGGMEWTGNFRIDLEEDYQNNLKIIAGINNYASAYPLKPGKTFTTPKFWYVLSFEGEGQASRKLQTWARKYKILNGTDSRLTLFNNWYTTGFDYNEKEIYNLIEGAGKLGVDLFLLDDGWFGNKYPRNNDSTGLGDWKVNRTKLPNGISGLVKKAKENGLKFGIWIEPEMVDPRSNLYHKHPNWVIKAPNRKGYYMRHQLVLDLSNPKVQNFVFNVVDNLLTKYPGIAYIKWDCNSVIYNAYSYYLKDQSKLYIDYVEGLYKVLERLRAKYPNIPMMLCSGGGGRVDYGALQYFTEFWPSDNTNPLDRIYMQWAYSYFFPAISMDTAVSTAGKYSPKFRVDVAMMGVLGFYLPMNKINKKELEFYKQSVQTYNEIKSIIWHGNQYRLASPWKNDVAALMYMGKKKNKGVIFNYLVSDRYDARSKRPIKLRGLNPNKKYTIKEINLYPGTSSTIDSSKIYSGQYLMTIGFNPDVNKSRRSVVLKIQEIE